MPLAEHDLCKNPMANRHNCFNSRAPRGARRVVSLLSFGDIIVSIHVPLAEHDITEGRVIAAKRVSIHVPLAEHDRAHAA